MWHIVELVERVIQKLLRGIYLGLIGLQGYYYYPRLLWYPLIQGLFAALLVSFGMVAVYITKAREMVPGESTSLGVLAFALIILFVYSSIFASVLLNVAACHTTAAHCEGNNIGFLPAVRKGLGSWKVILQLSGLLSVTRLFSGKRKKRGIWSLMGRATWSFLTFFIYPTISFENKNLFEAATVSIALSKENIGTVTGINLAYWALYKLAGLVAAISIVITGVLIHMLLAMLNIDPTHINNIGSGLGVFIVTFPVVFILMGTLQFVSIAKVIISTVLYRRLKGYRVGTFEGMRLDQ